MLILSQDKTRIVNFKNKEDIFLKEDYYEGKFIGTKIIAIGKIDSLLGKYNTEERAKEVLQDIIKAYRDYRTAECDGYTNVLQETAVYETAVYEMPEK